MKKNFKKTLAKVMAIALTVALTGTLAPEADAAKKIKLSSKSITVTKGKTKKVTIKNVTAKKVKKLTVKSSKKKIATVKKSGKTAFKVTGKKAGDAKVTVKVTVKGKKKATTLTLKVKVKNAAKPKVTVAPTAVPTVAPTLAPTPTPANTNNENKDNGNKDDGNKDNGNKDEETKDLSKQVYGETDPYVITISELNEALATSDAKRALTGAAAGGYRKDVVFGNNTVTFTSVKPDNSGVVFYVNPISEDDIVTTEAADGKVSVNVNTKAADLTQYSKIEIDVSDAFTETSLKLFKKGEANSWWSKMEKYEGTNSMDEGDRTITWDLSAWNVADLKEIDAIGLAWHNSDGYTGTIKEIRLVGAKEPAIPEPVVNMTLGASAIAVGETTSAEVSVKDAEASTITWASTDTEKVEVTADANDSKKAVVTAKVATVETTEVVATVRTTTGKEVTVKKAIKVTDAPVVIEPISLTTDTKFKYQTKEENGTEWPTSTATWKLAEMTGYKAFELSDYASVTIKFKAYNDKEAQSAIITAPADWNAGSAKFTLNNTKDSGNIYNWGNGDGYVKAYWHDASVDSEGVFTVSMNIPAENASDIDCIAMQSGAGESVRVIEIQSVTFNPKSK